MPVTEVAPPRTLIGRKSQQYRRLSERPRITPQTPYEDLPQWVLAEDAAAYLQLNVATIRAHIRAGRFGDKWTRFGRKYYIAKECFDLSVMKKANIRADRRQVVSAHLKQLVRAQLQEAARTADTPTADTRTSDTPTKRSTYVEHLLRAGRELQEARS